jgi:P-type Cu+ transporter
VTSAVTGGWVQAELVVTGMTCGACAARIERRLNRLDGVSATVNYATGRAYFTSLGGREAPELIGVINSTGYRAALPEPEGNDAADPSARGLGLRLAFCAPLALVVIALSMVPGLQYDGWQWTALVLAAPVAVWGAWPLHRSALAGLRHATATMDTLVSLAVTVSFGWSLYALSLGGAGMAGMRMPFAFSFTAVNGQTLYLDAAAGVTAAVITGRYLEARAKRRTTSALTAMAALSAKSVAVLRNGAEHRVPAAELAVGDRFVVRLGERVASDGVVVEGSSAIDATLLTGESMPAEVGPGDRVTGATVNMSGRLVVRATQVGQDTVLAQITRLVTQAQASKASAQRLADRIAAVFVPCVISAAVATLGFWLGAGLPGPQACSAAVAVLVVACPCALGLATPAALVAAVGRGAELGILAKSARAFESARMIRVVAFDKTGTLTVGAMTVTAVVAGPGTAADEALLLAGAVEDASEHPIGQAIAREAARFGGLPPVTGFTSRPGAGVTGWTAGRDVTVAGQKLLTELSVHVPAELAAAAATAEQGGQTAVLVGWNGSARAVVVVSDQVRPDAPDAVDRLRRLGLRPLLITGDSHQAALAIARQVGIDPADVFAGVRPVGKAEIIRRLQASGEPAAFVGDGVNDAAALAQADLGLALATGTDAAIGAADLTLVGGDLTAVADAVSLARAAMTVIRANLTWAFGYNVIAVPLAALGYLNPLLAGVAMTASSLIVVANSLRLHGFRPSATRARGPLACHRWRHRPLRGLLAARSQQARPFTGANARGWPARLVKAAAGPAISAVVLVGLLTAWAAAGGAGTLGKTRLQVTLAAVPMRAFTPQLSDSIATAGTFLTISNLGGTADELIAVRSPVSRNVTLSTRTGLGAQPTVVVELTVPAHGTLTLSPVADDAVLHDPVPFEGRQTVQLTLVFRQAGQITIDAPVTIPGTP